MRLRIVTVIQIIIALLLIVGIVRSVKRTIALSTDPPKQGIGPRLPAFWGNVMLPDTLRAENYLDSVTVAFTEHLAWDKKRDAYIDSLTAWLDREHDRVAYWRKLATDALLRPPKIAHTVPAESLSNRMYLVHEHEVWTTDDPFGAKRFWQDDSGAVALDPPWQEWRRVQTP